MKNALVKIMAVVLTLAAVIVAVGLLKPTSAEGEGKLKINVVLWKSATDQDNFRVGLTDILSEGVKIEKDSTNKNILHVETKLPQVNTNNPVFKLYKNKEGQTFEGSDLTIGDQEAKADLIAHVEFDKEEAKTWTTDTTVQIFQGVTPTIQGVSAKVPAKQYFVLNAEKTNVFVTYLSPVEVDPELGIHDWGFGNPTAWGTLNNAFKVAGEVNNKKVAVVHLTTENPQGGGVIVMNKGGSDDNKLSANIDNTNIFKDLEHLAGSSVYAFVIGKGNGYVKGDNIYSATQLDEAVEKTFSFGFTPEKIGVTGLEGTTAKNKTTIFVETITPIVLETSTEELEPEKLAELKQNKLKEYFTVHEKDNEEAKLEIKEIATDYSGTITSSLVITLATEIDNTKDYVLSYNNKKEGSEKQASNIDLSIDKTAPVLVFDSNEVKVEYNKEFDFNLIPGYSANDDRDGDLLESVYVPGADENNEKRFIDPSVKGEYEVVFKVVDTWGNITTQTVKFIVE